MFWGKEESMDKKEDVEEKEEGVIKLRREGDEMQCKKKESESYIFI